MKSTLGQSYGPFTAIWFFHGHTVFSRFSRFSRAFHGHIGGVSRPFHAFSRSKCVFTAPGGFSRSYGFFTVICPYDRRPLFKWSNGSPGYMRLRLQSFKLPVRNIGHSWNNASASTGSASIKVVVACATARLSGQTITSILSAGSAPSSRATRRFFLTPRSSVMPPSVSSSTFPQITRNVAAWATQARRSPSSSIRRISSNLEVPKSVEQTAAIAGESPSAAATTHKH